MKILFILIAVFICFQIAYQKDYKKILWLLGGLLFFPHSIAVINEPVMLSFHRLFIYTLFFATLFQKKHIWAEYKKLPVSLALLAVFIASLITGLSDDRINIFHKFYRPLTYFFENFLVLFLAYIHIRNTEGVFSVYKKYVIFLVFFGLYGISNYFTRTNEYYNLLQAQFGASNFASANMREHYLSRFRVSSFSFHAILYGLVLSTGILIFLFLYYYVYQKRVRVLYLSILALIFVNLLLVNSRTPILSLIAGGAIFFLWGLRLKAKTQILGLLALFVITSGIYLKDFRDTMIASIDVFTSKESNISGSSMEMRREQLEASLEFFRLKPVAGNGFQFIVEVLGYSSKKSQNWAPEKLRGLESYLFRLLIEQGIVGLVANIFLFTSLIIYFLRRRRNMIALLGLAMLTGFLLFIFGTGDLNSFPFFMTLMGVTIKGVQMSLPSKSRKPQSIPEPMQLQ